MYVCIYALKMHLCMYSFQLYASMYVYAHIIYVCMHMFANVYMYIYVYINTYMRLPKPDDADPHLSKGGRGFGTCCTHSVCHVCMLSCVYVLAWGVEVLVRCMLHSFGPSCVHVNTCVCVLA